MSVNSTCRTEYCVPRCFLSLVLWFISVGKNPTYDTVVCFEMFCWVGMCRPAFIGVCNICIMAEHFKARLLFRLSGYPLLVVLNVFECIDFLLIANFPLFCSILISSYLIAPDSIFLSVWYRPRVVGWMVKNIQECTCHSCAIALVDCVVS